MLNDRFSEHSHYLIFSQRATVCDGTPQAIEAAHYAFNSPGAREDVAKDVPIRFDDLAELPERRKVDLFTRSWGHACIDLSLEQSFGGRLYGLRDGVGIPPGLSMLVLESVDHKAADRLFERIKYLVVPRHSRGLGANVSV